jgi:predicted DNA-binding transcriptional regulator AlpA
MRSVLQEPDQMPVPEEPRRARRVIRLSQLPGFLGVQRSAIDDLVKRGLLHPFNLTDGGRSKVVFEDEIAALQEKAAAKAKRGGK